MSKQAHGVNIYAPSLGDGKFSQKANWIISPKNDLPPKPASNPLDEGRGWSNEGDIHAPRVPLLLEQAVHSLGLSLAKDVIGVGVEETHQSTEWRV